MERNGLFVSYRRDDASGSAQWLHSILKEEFSRADGDGDREVFLDIDDIPPGEDFRDVIRRTLGRCNVVLVVVGPRWLSARTADGGRRLDDPADFHALEIREALASEARTIPVLVEGTSMPLPSELPKDLEEFAYLNAWTLSQRHFRDDVAELVSKLLEAERNATQVTTRARVVPPNASLVVVLAVTIGLVGAVIALAILWAVNRTGDDEITGSPASPEDLAPSTDSPSGNETEPLPDTEETPDTEGTSEAVESMPGESGDMSVATRPSNGGQEQDDEAEIEVAVGTTLDLSECPEDWESDTGLDRGVIRLGHSVPPAFASLSAGMEIYFDHVNEADPIDGNQVVLVARDDASTAERSTANVKDLIDNGDVFALVGVVNTPVNSLATREMANEACVPQLFNYSGSPFWGDPATWPWAAGSLLNFVTEADVWCRAIVDEFGEEASVALLTIDADLGRIYREALRECAQHDLIDIVREEAHDKSASDVNQIVSRLAESEAEVLIAATTATFCPQTAEAVAASEWRPRIIMPQGCRGRNLFSLVEPLVASLAADGAGIRVADEFIDCNSPESVERDSSQEFQNLLVQIGIDCADRAQFVGALFGQFMEDALRAASELPGGINRVNLMQAVWNTDSSSAGLSGGTTKLDGVVDAYLIESAQMREIRVENDTIVFEPVGDVIDLEGERGSVQDLAPLVAELEP